MPFKDHFSELAKDYSRYRPRYPRELFEYLASLVPQHELAWDCATGNGQAALGLVPFFDKVIATDASEKQIAQATRHEKIQYEVAPAERTEIASQSVDLITVAQALHWFDFEKFYAEAKRVLKPSGVLSSWCYTFFESDPSVDELVMDYYTNVVGPYWPADRKLIEEKYETIPFPLQRREVPVFYMHNRWSLDDLIGYLGTWSATQKYIEKNAKEPLSDLKSNLEKVWGDSGLEKDIRWRIYLKVGTF